MKEFHLNQIKNHLSLRVFLRNKLESHTNSLRKISSDIGISASSISGFINSKRNLSKEKITTIVNYLSETESERIFYLNALAKSITTINVSDYDAVKSVDAYTDLDAFDLVIVNLIGNKFMYVTDDSLSKIVNVDEQECHKRLKKLIKLKYITLSGKKYISHPRFEKFKSSRASNSTKKIIIEMLERANQMIRDPERDDECFVGGFPIWIEGKDYESFEKDYLTFQHLVKEKYMNAKSADDKLFRVNLTLTPEI